ncbi:MAG: 2-oxoglutarate ferredoxin oxidoreductase subunit alpha [Planctomycetota bacterium]|nr:MAG: 2-oxoglutarate ferredoxin oxidoreductase subunit alpha [Planctomycetota bacterium]
MTTQDASVDKDRPVETLDQAIIRFAGDSGDGMQLTGTEFSNSAALFGNDLATFPDFPAEIRAPAGTLPGVSAFQVRFSSHDIFTPGNQPDVLVAMNAAALKVHLPELQKGGIVIANAGGFGRKDLKVAGWEKNPLDDENLANDYRMISVDLNQLTKETLKDSGLDSRSQMRCKNFAALGILYWLYNRDLSPTIEGIKAKFAKKKPEIADANIAVLKAGYNFAITIEVFQRTYRVDPAPLPKGTYRNINGNAATSLGCLAASKLAHEPLFLGSYPITPASEILQQLSGYKQHGVVTFQAEDEIAGICSAIGAAYAGHLALTTSSGPGIALKSEAMGLAVMTELPLVIVNVQRGGPSTGLPTKTEQADLLQAVYGRNGECPVPVIAAKSPADCFYQAIEAFRLAIKYVTPVMLLTDGYLANGSEPWLLPKEGELEEFKVEYRSDPEGFQPYSRDPETLARPWVKPGTPGMRHRIGGLEKADGVGNISYDPANHEKMCHLRRDKVLGIAKELSVPEVVGDDGGILMVGWGSTYGAMAGTLQTAREKGIRCAHLHLTNLWPLPPGLDEIFDRYDKILVTEMNLGQLVKLLRAERPSHEYLSFTKIQGRPFYNNEILAKLEELNR